MNAFAKCCLYYCSGVMIVGIAFYSVILIMLATESRYLKPENVKEGYQPTFKDHMQAVGIAMIVRDNQELSNFL